MKANELPINTFLQAANVQFVIPVYQRNYDWSSNECKELLNDIVAVETENRGTHFIGSIVFIHEGTYSTSEVKELVIIDGQQRLTTITILIVALYRFAKENGMDKEAEMLYHLFLTNQYVQNDDSKLKLKQTDNNSLAFKAILMGNEPGFTHYSNVIENYRYFRSRIQSEEDFHTIKGGLRRLIFVEISLERDKDDPQRIFESLNSTGLDLSQSDLIRNFILMDLPPRDQQRVFDHIWNPIEENARDTVHQRSLVSDYIRDYLTLKTKRIPNKGNVYAEFKKLFAHKREVTFQEDLENLKALSYHYKKLIQPQAVQNHNLRQELLYISRLEINVAYPFLLQVFEDAENGIIDTETIVRILKLIQSYAWRRFIVGLPTNALNKIFMTLYAEIDQDEYYESLELALLRKKSSAKFPTDEEIRTALKDKDVYNTQPKNRNYFFELLENHNNREHVNTSNPNITIEHIFPQTPTEEWANSLSKEAFFELKEQRLNTIANLTLSGNNGSLSNRPFLEKRDMNQNGGEQGYRFSRMWLNTYLKELDRWDLDTYNERFQQIYERFLAIWPYPTATLPTTEGTGEQNIFDAPSPRHQQLEYFIFENTKVEEEVIAKMYVYVINRLLEKNPELLLNNRDVFKINRNPGDFRTPQEVGLGYFIESNLDSQSKFGVLKRLLTLFEMEDELIIKYNDGSGDTPNRFLLRKQFWQTVLPAIQEVAPAFAHNKPNKDTWQSIRTEVSGCLFVCAATKNGARIDLWLATSNKETNKRYFRQLEQKKAQIETKFGQALVWHEWTDYKLSTIHFADTSLSIFNQSDWEAMQAFFCRNIIPFMAAFEEELKTLK